MTSIRGHSDYEFGSYFFHRSNSVPEQLYVMHIVRCRREHTSYNSFYKWIKIPSLEIIIFELTNDVKKWSRIYFEIDRAPLEILAKLPG
jgi:hypothetical protein